MSLRLAGRLGFMKVFSKGSSFKGCMSVSVQDCMLYLFVNCDHHCVKFSLNWIMFYLLILWKGKNPNTFKACQIYQLPLFFSTKVKTKTKTNIDFQLKTWEWNNKYSTWKLFFGHKSTLAVPGRKSVLFGISCNCNLTKPNLPYLTKFNIPCPNPAGGSLTFLALPEATLLQHRTQLLVARLLISKVTKIWWKIFWDC